MYSETATIPLRLKVSGFQFGFRVDHQYRKNYCTIIPEIILEKIFGHARKGYFTLERMYVLIRKHNILVLCTLIALLLTPVVVFSTGLEMVSGKGCYQYGDNDTPSKARKIALDMAKRSAIENSRAFVSSLSVVKDFALEKDVISSISAGYLYDLKVVKEERHNRNICVSIKAFVKPHQVAKEIENKLRAQELGLNTSNHTELVREGIVDWDRKIIRVQGFGAASRLFPRHVWKKSAEEAAIVDAQTKLVEMIDGFKLDSKTFVTNYQISKDEKIKEIKGKLKYVESVRKTTYPTEDTAEVVLQLTLEDIL